MSRSTYPGHALRVGDTGPDVKRAQAMLNEHGWKLAVDGDFGPATLHAVNVFKAHRHMPADGILGPNAWAQLFNEPRAHKATADRVHPLVVVRMNVACQSDRSTPIDGIVLHDTEGANIPGITDLQGLGAYFDRIQTQASAHVGVDAEGQSARYVPDQRKAWHVAAFNSRKLGVEQIGFASQKNWPIGQLRETARWCAHWCLAYDLPIVHDVDRGICMHSDLGAAGGGHHDPGESYPLDHVLALTQHYYDLRKKG